MNLLEQIDSPADLKQLTKSELKELAGECGERVCENGFHCETCAWHRSFLPKEPGTARLVEALREK